MLGLRGRSIGLSILGIACCGSARAALIGLDDVSGTGTTRLGSATRWDAYRQLIVDAGHTPVPLSEFTSTSLSPLRAVVVLEPLVSALTPSDVGAIREFVAGGGGLIIHGEGSTHLTWGPSALAESYGVTFNPGFVTEGESHTITSFVPHALTTGVGAAGVHGQRQLLITAPAVDLTPVGGPDNFLAVVEGSNGSGNVVILSDTSYINDANEPANLLTPITYRDNAVLARNIIQYVTVPEPTVPSGLLVFASAITLRRRRLRR